MHVAFRMHKLIMQHTGRSGTEEGEARHRKNKRLKLGGGQAVVSE
jgi:hypothetical protein